MQVKERKYVSVRNELDDYNLSTCRSGSVESVLSDFSKHELCIYCNNK
jgi:hypothetical protein